MAADNASRTHSRREFLATTGAVAGAAAIGVGPSRYASAATPKRGGVLRFATRSDAVGLDPHRQIVYYVSQPLAATTQGLLDYNDKLDPVAGIATEWDISKDLKRYSFKLRQGAEYHNGRTVDAESVKWNYERILDPKIGHSFTRSSLLNVERIEAPDPTTLHIYLKDGASSFLSDVTYYPVNLIAPDSADQADTHPIGCGPFKFVSWRKFDTTELTRFENYFETGVDGKPLPYLDGIVGLPKKEDRVRFTALRTGEVHLIENMPYADAGTFEKQYGKDYNTHPIDQVGTGFVSFNMKNGPFSYQNPHGHDMRLAAAHAIDHEAIHQAVFYGLSAAATGFYSKASSWHMPEAKRWPEFDPDKAKFYLKKAKYANERITLVSRDAYAYMNQTGELVHAMWTDAGFNVGHEIHPEAVLRAKYKSGEWHGDSSANSYRPDPDGWFFKQIHSQGADNLARRGYKNEKVDKLVEEARRTVDHEKRRQLYAEVETIVNTELPVVYTHFIPLLGASDKALKDYQPAFPGPFSYRGGGVRVAWFDV